MSKSAESTRSITDASKVFELSAPPSSPSTPHDSRPASPTQIPGWLSATLIHGATRRQSAEWDPSHRTRLHPDAKASVGVVDASPIAQEFVEEIVSVREVAVVKEQRAQRAAVRKNEAAEREAAALSRAAPLRKEAAQQAEYERLIACAARKQQRARAEAGERCARAWRETPTQMIPAMAPESARQKRDRLSARARRFAGWE